MLDVDTVLQNALNRVADTLLVAKDRRKNLRDAIDKIVYNIGAQNKEDAQDITNGIMRGLFNVGPEEPPESESDLKARIAALEEKIKQLTQPLVKETAAGTPTPPFAVGAIVEHKQGAIKGTLVVINVYIADDGEGHRLWYVDAVRYPDGVSYKKVFSELLQLVGKAPTFNDYKDHVR